MSYGATGRQSASRKSGQWNQNSLNISQAALGGRAGGEPELRGQIHGPEFRSATHLLSDLKQVQEPP